MKKAGLLLVLLAIVLSIVSCSGLHTGLGGGSGIDKPFAQNYTVKFETNGGTKVTSQKLNVLEKAPQTTRENYLFDGWYRDKSLTTVAVFPLTLEADTILYAKWLKIKGTMQCDGAVFKNWEGFHSGGRWSVTPVGFDYDALKRQEYIGINITVTYDVYYRKDYDALWDVGYAGAPKYEASLMNSGGVGTRKNNLSTTQSASQRSISCGFRFDEMDSETIYLRFATENVQNKVYIDNIIVTYECVK